GIANTSGLLLSSTVTTEDSKITENFTNGLGGGGILNVDLTPNLGGTANLTIRNSEITKNKATLGGGIRNTNGTLTPTNTRITNNTALTTNGGGGINTNTTITTDPTTTTTSNRPTNCTGTVTNCFG
ncbi:right-handed parallel beta-helix repeat-containing protein, partial [Micromonospora sp. NPDC002575]